MFRGGTGTWGRTSAMRRAAAAAGRRCGRRTCPASPRSPSRCACLSWCTTCTPTATSSTAPGSSSACFSRRDHPPARQIAPPARPFVACPPAQERRLPRLNTCDGHPERPVWRGPSPLSLRHSIRLPTRKVARHVWHRPLQKCASRHCPLLPPCVLIPAGHRAAYGGGAALLAAGVCAEDHPRGVQQGVRLQRAAQLREGGWPQGLHPLLVRQDDHRHHRRGAPPDAALSPGSPPPSRTPAARHGVSTHCHCRTICRRLLSCPSLYGT